MEKKLNVLMKTDCKVARQALVACSETPDLSFRIINESTGEVLPSLLFVAMLPATFYCYAEVTAEKDIAGWIGCHTRAFRFFGGTARTLIPVHGTNPSFETHDLFIDMLGHYSTKIGNSTKNSFPLQLLLRWLKAMLQDEVFPTTAAANSRIWQLIHRFNTRTFKKVAGSPKCWFESIERPRLISCPAQVFSTEILVGRQVANDCYVNIDGWCYSVPSTLAGEQPDIRVTPDFVEFFFNGRRTTFHTKPDPVQRGSLPRPKSNDEAKPDTDWSPHRVLRWAKSVGPATSHVVATILTHSHNSSKGVCSCLGILSLEQEYGRERLERACLKATSLRCWTVKFIRSLLKAGIDQSVIQLTIPNLILPPAKQRERRMPAEFSNSLRVYSRKKT